MQSIAVIGAGLIGRAWAIVFARAGHRVRLWDPEPRALGEAQAMIAERLEDLAKAGLLREAAPAVAARIAPSASLGEALEGARHVQESGPERLDAKQALFAELDARCGPEVVLASSTSGIPASRFTEGLPGRARCLVAHPVNPPYLVPLVELVGAPWTAAEAIARTRTLMATAGMVPVIAHKETAGFVLNRLQAALVAEAFRLVRAGVMSVEDVDACVRDGLGLRWVLMGPFETCDLNAPGGFADYVARYGPLFSALAKEMGGCDFDAPTVAAVDAARRAQLPREQIAARSAWRDRALMALLRRRAEIAGAD